MAKHQEKKEEFIEETSELGKIFAAWEIPEFIQPERSKQWYLYFAVIAIALLVYSYFSSNPLFAIIIIMFIIIYLVMEKRGPNNLNFLITEDGIVIGQKLIEYKDLENFYIIYYPPKIKNLYLQPKNALRNRLTIPLLDQNPVVIRKALLQYLSEDISKEEIPASESISEILKL